MKDFSEEVTSIVSKHGFRKHMSSDIWFSPNINIFANSNEYEIRVFKNGQWNVVYKTKIGVNLIQHLKTFFRKTTIENILEDM